MNYVSPQNSYVESLTPKVMGTPNCLNMGPWGNNEVMTAGTSLLMGLVLL